MRPEEKGKRRMAAFCLWQEGDVYKRQSVCSAKELKIFLLTGQSNSLGAVKGSPASPALLKKYEPKNTLYWHENFGQREGVFPLSLIHI